MSIKYRDYNGHEEVIAGLTPGGDLEAGAVATRSGTVTTTSITPGDTITQSITFIDPMPVADYEVLLHQTDTFVLGRISNKTINGFDIIVRNDDLGAAASTCTIDYFAFKTYDVQHAAQNAEDLAEIKAMIPAGTSSANKLVNNLQMTTITNPLVSGLADVQDVIPSNASISNKLITADDIVADAEDVTYDNTTSGLTATDVQAAIDEIAGGSSGHIIEDELGLDLPQRSHLQFNGAYMTDDSTNDRSSVNVYRSMTQAEYDVLPTTARKGMILITDAPEGTIEGTDVIYSHSTSHLAATNVQDAIDEIVEENHTVELEALATNVYIERCGRLRKITVTGASITTTGGSFDGLNGLLTAKDLPRQQVFATGLAVYNSKYYPLYVGLNTSGVFSGYGLDTSLTTGWQYLTGTPTLYFEAIYFV